MGLTVATFNLRHDADEWERRAPLIVAELGSLKPHVIALQEICLPIGQARWLAGALNGRQGAGEQPYECVERRQWPAGTMPDERGVHPKQRAKDVHVVHRAVSWAHAERRRQALIRLDAQRSD
jgi:hypothetical protein